MQPPLIGVVHRTLTYFLIIRHDCGIVIGAKVSVEDETCQGGELASQRSGP